MPDSDLHVLSKKPALAEGFEYARALNFPPRLSNHSDFPYLLVTVISLSLGLQIWGHWKGDFERMCLERGLSY